MNTGANNIMILSKYRIEQMGFNEFPDNDILEATFSIIKVYSLRGLFFEPDCEDNKSEAVSLTDSCTVVIAQSVNEALKTIIGYRYVDDEEKWLSEKKATPPFLLIYFKGRERMELHGGYRKKQRILLKLTMRFLKK